MYTSLLPDDFIAQPHQLPDLGYQLIADHVRFQGACDAHAPVAVALGIQVDHIGLAAIAVEALLLVGHTGQRAGLTTLVFVEDVVQGLAVKILHKGVDAVRVAYEEKSRYCDGGEAYVIYLDPERNGDWGMSVACALKDDRVSYQLVTNIRQLMDLGYDIIWK